MDRESQKRWDRTNMVTISCRITKKKADELTHRLSCFYGFIFFNDIRFRKNYLPLHIPKKRLSRDLPKRTLGCSLKLRT